MISHQWQLIAYAAYNMYTINHCVLIVVLWSARMTGEGWELGLVEQQHICSQTMQRLAVITHDGY